MKALVICGGCGLGVNDLTAHNPVCLKESTTIYDVVVFAKGVDMQGRKVNGEPVIIPDVPVPTKSETKLAHARAKFPSIEKAEADMFDNGKYTGAKFSCAVQPDTIGQRTILIPKGENIAEIIARHL